MRTFFATLLLLPSIIVAQCNTNLNSYSSGFKKIEANTFSFLDNQLAHVKIVGLGEDTHGSAEFTLLTKEALNYLSSKHQFNILFLETGFSEGLYFNDYVHGKRSSIKSILNKHNSTWRYNTKEFIELMDWIKNYNKTSKTKINIYGTEMQYVMKDVSRIQDYLTRVQSNYKIKGFEKHIWQQITEKEKSDYYNSYAQLKAYFLENQKKFKEQTSEKEYQLIYHLIEILGQFTSTINQHVYQRKMDLRDLYIAENIEWVLAYENQNSKALYWAHNVHVGNWISNGIVDVAGHHLKKRFGNAYYNIATDFGTGDFIAFAFDPKKDGRGLQKFSFKAVDTTTFTYCIKKLGTPNAILDLRNAKQQQTLKNYLENPLKIMYGAGATEWGKQTQTVTIGKAFDALIYLDNVTAINFIKE